MFLGRLEFTNSFREFEMAGANGFIPIALAESLNDLDVRNKANIQLASVLLPSYEAVSLALDNDIANFANVYQAQLCTRECDEFITLMMLALRNRNVILYISKDEMEELPYVRVLFDYIRNFFGYNIGMFNQGQAMYNPQYDAVLINKFYSYDFITKEEFFAQYPPNVEIDPFTVSKLAYDTDPYDCGNPQRFTGYFMDAVKAAHGIFKTFYTKGG